MSGYKCICHPPYTGDLCDEFINYCEVHRPCHQRAVSCESFEGKDYICRCPPGYTGKDCHIEYDECASGPCIAPRAKCIDEVDAFFCECPAGYMGVFCEIIPCDSHPCQNLGVCEFCREEIYIKHTKSTEIQEGFRCYCQDGWEGDFCEINSNECVSAPCHRGATCHDLVAGFRCECTADAKGVYWVRGVFSFF